MGEKNNVADEKKNIRKKILSLRNELPLKLREEKSNIILQSLYGMEQYRATDVILTYVDCQSEVITTPIITGAIAKNKQVFAPRVCGEEMEFYRIAGIGDLAEGYKGIREPICEDGFMTGTWSFRNPGEPTGVLMVMPGAVFDREGHRIGYGKGFYDRYLNRLTVNGINVYKIALCYECQLLNKVPYEAHDVCADVIITENGINFCRLRKEYGY